MLWPYVTSHKRTWGADQSVMPHCLRLRLDRFCSPVRGLTSMAMPWSPKGLPDRTSVRSVSLQATRPVKVLLALQAMFSVEACLHLAGYPQGELQVSLGSAVCCSHATHARAPYHHSDGGSRRATVGRVRADTRYGQQSVVMSVAANSTCSRVAAHWAWVGCTTARTGRPSG